MRITTQNGRLVLGDDRRAERGVAAMDEAADVRRISEIELKTLGMSRIAYVKAVQVDGDLAYAIHAADGTPMALAGDQETAFGAILQHEMIPALVH